jgi:hypothetical protein
MQSSCTKFQRATNPYLRVSNKSYELPAHSQGGGGGKIPGWGRGGGWRDPGGGGGYVNFPHLGEVFSSTVRRSVFCMVSGQMYCICTVQYNKCVTFSAKIDVFIQIITFSSKQIIKPIILSGRVITPLTRWYINIIGQSNDNSQCYHPATKCSGKSFIIQPLGNILVIIQPDVNTKKTGQ